MVTCGEHGEGGMVGWICRLLVLGAWVTGLGVAGSGAAHADDEQRRKDARAVYCLHLKHREDLVRAAAALGLATPASVPTPSPASSPTSSPAPTPRPAPSDQVSLSGGNVPVEKWRAAHPPAFDRACAALIGAVPAQLAEPAGPWPAIIGGMVPVAVGALLTLGATGWSLRRQRTAKVAADLRTAAIAYRRAAGEYMDSWVTGGRAQPDDTQVRSTMHDLEAQLSLVCAARLRGAAHGRRLLEELRGDRAVPWGTVSAWQTAVEEVPGGREGFRRRCREAVDRDVTRAQDLATGVERLLPRPGLPGGRAANRLEMGKR
jgi:hypothetical protein